MKKLKFYEVSIIIFYSSGDDEYITLRNHFRSRRLTAFIFHLSSFVCSFDENKTTNLFWFMKAMKSRDWSKFVVFYSLLKFDNNLNLFFWSNPSPPPLQRSLVEVICIIIIMLCISNKSSSSILTFTQFDYRLQQTLILSLSVAFLKEPFSMMEGCPNSCATPHFTTTTIIQQSNNHAWTELSVTVISMGGGHLIY